MTITVYGLRIKGDKEVRYIGQSANVEQRLASHLRSYVRMTWPTDFALWLKHNASEIEAVKLAYAPTREEARKIERMVVETFAALDHRLFNQWLVPPKKRLSQRTGPQPHWMRAA